MAARQGRLGEYLRARRERTTPARAGVAIVGERRRVPGLKRGEVAQLAGISLMVALSPMYRPGTNIVRAAFLDHAVYALFADPETRLENVVYALRALVGADTDDPYLTELVAEVSAESAQFRLLWSRHDVRPHPGGGVHRLHHPNAGDLELSYDKFMLVGADRQMLTVYQAEPGSPSEKALTLLAAADT